MKPHVEDVAAALLQRLGPLDTYRLQKLVYYCQAWHLAWRDAPLFPERVEAWADGPVVRRLFKLHQHKYKVRELSKGDPRNIPEDSAPVLDFVCGYYGHKTGAALSALTHREPPWRDTRKKAKLGAGDRGSPEIPPSVMRDYYRSKEIVGGEGWYWTKAWLDGERIATEDIKAGRVVSSKSDDDFLSSL